ncbi:MAG TPA: hypothetical protein LFW10_04050 [Rickettsia endosymbiont of Diachasma alloeum]|nr:hypothetical protein [Rickettsia endosymbiont of Diachasma alloeum]
MTIFHFVISGWQNIECKSLIQRADWVEILFKIVTNVSNPTRNILFCL